jgi:hypothetical protein
MSCLCKSLRGSYCLYKIRNKYHVYTSYRLWKRFRIIKNDRGSFQEVDCITLTKFLHDMSSTLANVVGKDACGEASFLAFFFACDEGADRIGG